MNPDRPPRSFALLLAVLLLAPCAPLPAAAPLAQEYSVVYHNADPEYCVEGPGLVRLDDGGLLAVVPVVPREKWSEERRVEHGAVHLLHSADAGRTWQPRCDLPYYSAAPWLDRGTLYLLAIKPRAGKKASVELVLSRSDDQGRKWSPPLTLSVGDYWISQTAMVERDRRLYCAVDDLSSGTSGAPRLIAGDLSGDPMNAKSWRISDPARLLKTFGTPDTKYAELPVQHTEPNVIEVNGQLRLLTGMRFKRPAPAGFCGVLDASDDGTRLGLKFHHFSPLPPGGQLKSCMVRDEVSGLFWATSNLQVESGDLYGWAKQESERGKYKASAGDRRLLMLSYSLDGLNWFPAGCVAQAGRLSQSFLDARPVIDGEDLAIIARASIQAPDQQDADHATFHRVRDFRSLALKLHPEVGGE